MLKQLQLCSYKVSHKAARKTVTPYVWAVGSISSLLPPFCISESDTEVAMPVRESAQQTYLNDEVDSPKASYWSTVAARDE